MEMPAAAMVLSAWRCVWTPSRGLARATSRYFFGSGFGSGFGASGAFVGSGGFGASGFGRMSATRGGISFEPLKKSAKSETALGGSAHAPPESRKGGSEERRGGEEGRA